jgi:hypothetical protein
VQVFPPEVHSSLAELRTIAKTARSKDDPRLRRATLDEIALARTLHKDWMCTKHSIRTGLPCEQPKRKHLDMCRKHGGALKRVQAKLERQLATLAPAMLVREQQLATQTENPTVAQKATADLLDRAGVGAVVQAKVRHSHKEQTTAVVVNIGFLG